MSFWNKIIETIGGSGNHPAHQEEVLYDASRYAFVDVEVGMTDLMVHDIGALRWDGAVFHKATLQAADATA